MTGPAPSPFEDLLDTKALAAVDLVRRTGAREFQLRLHDEPGPVLWVAYAAWPSLRARDAAAGLTPAQAIYRLCEQTIDGGTCQHCRRTTTFLPEVDDHAPLPGLCAYQWDPELSTFRRSCEGAT